MTNTDTNKKGVGGTNSKALHTNTNGASFRTDRAFQQANDGKAIVTLIAQLAVAGHQVYRLEDGFLVCRWGMSRHCPDFASLLGFAKQIGACHA